MANCYTLESQGPSCTLILVKSEYLGVRLRHSSFLKLFIIPTCVQVVITTSLKQCFSNLNLQMNHLGILLECRFLFGGSWWEPKTLFLWNASSNVDAGGASQSVTKSSGYINYPIPGVIGHAYGIGTVSILCWNLWGCDSEHHIPNYGTLTH